MHARSGSLTARLSLLGAALLFSSGGAVIKGTTLAPLQVAALRSAIAAASLLLLMPAARRHWRLANLPAAAVYAATLVLFVTATKLTTAANSIFLQSTAPLYILLLAPWLLHERVHRRDVPFIAVMAAGLSLFLIDQFTATATAIAPRPAAGNAAAAASGLTWALTLMALRSIGRSDPDASLNVVVVGNVLAALVCLPFALPLAIAPRDAAALLWLGVVQIGLAYVLLTRGVRDVAALDASLLLLAEPVLNPVWTWAVHGERPGAWALAGGAVILSATTARTISEARRTA